VKSRIEEDDPRIIEACQLIRKKSAELDVNGLAARFHLSPSRFAHLFKVNTSWSVTAYVNSCRVAHATLLTGTDLSIKEIAFRTGFGNSSTFSHKFKKITGMSPVAYRVQQKLTTQSICITDMYSGIIE
jgi:AraC-like DNA-binding protein